jgi:hypothetical protein
MRSDDGIEEGRGRSPTGSAAVDAADVPDDLRPVAFGKAVDLIVGISPGHDALAPVEPRERLKKRDQGPAPSGDPLEKIATKFGIEMVVVDEAFEAEDGTPKLTVPRQKLAKSANAATKEIALLVAAARQAAEIETWTDSQTIREAVEGYGKFNSPNFAASISELDDDFSFTGKRKSRRVKVRRDGFASAGALTKKLFGKATE